VQDRTTPPEGTPIYDELVEAYDRLADGDRAYQEDLAVAAGIDALDAEADAAGAGGFSGSIQDLGGEVPF
jgi:hypothetical protein